MAAPIAAGAGLLARLLGGLISTGKMAGSAAVGGIAGALPFMFMTGGSEEGPPTDLMGGGGGAGAGGEDIMALLQMLQGQAGGSRNQLKEDLAMSEGMLNMLNRQTLASRRPSTLGVADDLDAIIRGNEDLLGKIAYSEPLSMAQAYAMKGLYVPPPQPEVSFRGIM